MLFASWHFCLPSQGWGWGNHFGTMLGILYTFKYLYVLIYLFVYLFIYIHCYIYCYIYIYIYIYIFIYKYIESRNSIKRLNSIRQLYILQAGHETILEAQRGAVPRLE